jgi:hypothetical protein
MRSRQEGQEAHDERTPCTLTVRVLAPTSARIGEGHMKMIVAQRVTVSDSRGGAQRRERKSDAVTSGATTGA